MTEPTLLYPSFTMCPDYDQSRHPLSSNEWEFEKMRPMNQEVLYIFHMSEEKKK
jgi:hypothetical protein